MNQFDKRVNQLVDRRAQEIIDLFKDADDLVPEVDFTPVLDKLRLMHNLLADIKQEVRRTEKQTVQEKQKEKKKKPNPDLDWQNMRIEDLRQYIESDDPTLMLEGPGEGYDPNENAWDAFVRRLQEWGGFTIPHDGPDYWLKILEGWKKSGYNLWSFDPSDIWWFITHPKETARLSPSFWECLKMLFFPETLIPKMNEYADRAKKTVEAAKAQEQKNSNEINKNITILADQADDLAGDVITAITTCCATLNGKLDTIKSVLDEGGGPVVKQDTLLVRKKISELDTILDELRREVRQFRDLRGRTEAWAAERGI